MRHISGTRADATYPGGLVVGLAGRHEHGRPPRSRPSAVGPVAPPTVSVTGSVSRLQRLAGNNAVTQLLGRSGRDAQPKAGRTLQRAAPPHNPGAAPAPEGASPLRQEIFKLFAELEDKVIGDPETEKIVTKEKWEGYKKAEADYKAAKQKYDDDMARFKKGELKEQPKKPTFVAVYTTCIDTQAYILRTAFKRAGLKMKTTRSHLGTEGQKVAEKVGPDVWHNASAGMSERPKDGDIIILASRGKAVDKAAQDVAGLQAQLDKGEALEAKLAAAEQANAEARTVLEALEESDEGYQAAKRAVTTTMVALNAVKHKAAEAMKTAAKAEKLMPGAATKLEKARLAMDHTKVFEFSHVGILQKREINEDKTEKWTTFDGGQSVQSRKNEHGSETVVRHYDPKTNEISGEALQGGMARWLQGWIDVDKL